MPADSSIEGDGQREQTGTASKGAETPATAASASPTDAQAEPVAPAVASGSAIPSAAELGRMLRGVRMSDSSASSTHLFWDTQPVVKASEVKSITPAVRSLLLLRLLPVCIYGRRRLAGRHGLLNQSASDCVVFHAAAWNQHERMVLLCCLSSQDEGPIDSTKTVEDVRKEPYNLPSGFVWSECPVDDPAVLDELYELLALHYVEDDDNLFRFNYGREFLSWALTPPGALKEWIIGVRVETTRKLVGFITAIPTALQCNGKRIQVAEVNFLCVHKKLRSKRLAPVLIKEITRRVNSKSIWQAVYTAGIVLPTPVAECRYWHRSLNPKKLVEVGFSGLGQRMTISRSIKLYKVREEPALEGLRPMKESDAPQVHKLLMSYLRNFKLHPDFTEEEVRHWLTPRENVVYVYVRQHKGKITDLTSFYELPSSVIGHPKHKEVKAAYSFYNVATTVPLKELMQDALCLAKKKDFDVFNALDVMDNKTFVEELKFGVGDGFLRYYLYNWRCPQVLHKDIGLVLL